MTPNEAAARDPMVRDLLDDLERRTVELGLSAEAVARLRSMVEQVALLRRAGSSECEAELEQAKAEAERESESRSRALANISHALRTTLNAIMGMTDLALEETRTARVRDMLRTARYSADTLLELLDEILDLARSETGKLELEQVEFSLRDLLNRSLKPFGLPAAQKGLKLEWEVPADILEPLLGDPSRLSQVLANLVGNAIKFASRGEVKVRATVLEKLGDELVLQLSVRDRGIGISPEDQARIFEPFVQVDASMARGRTGSGLGLAISRRLVELMGGRIWVESRLGEGSTFSFTVRLAMSSRLREAESTRRQSSPLSAAPALPLQVLLAEDTPANQMLVVYILEHRGHEVTIADNGQQTIDLLRRHDFDVVLMDVQMPGVDGLQATAAIRAFDDPKKAEVPIIAMTAHALAGDRERCLAAGMDAYVSKPIDGPELIRLVERLGTAASRGRAPSGSAGTAAGGGGRSASGSPFDHAEAVKRCYGQERMFREMVASLLRESGPLAERMRTALARGDGQELAAAAHRLKNTVAYLAAAPATAATQRLVDLGRAGDLPAAAPALEELERELRRLTDAVAPYAAPGLDAGT